MGKKRFECRNCAQAWKERREKRLAKQAKLDKKAHTLRLEKEQEALKQEAAK